MKQTLRTLLLFAVVYFPLNAMEITETVERPNTPKYDRARDCFTNQPLSLIHCASKQVGKNIVSHFHKITGSTVDTFFTKTNNTLARLPIELQPLVEQQTLIEATTHGYTFDFSINCYASRNNMAYNITHRMLLSDSNYQGQLVKSELSPNKKYLTFTFQATDDQEHITVATNDNGIWKNKASIDEQLDTPCPFKYPSFVSFLDNKTFATCRLPSYPSNLHKVTIWNMQDEHVIKIQEEKPSLTKVIHVQDTDHNSLLLLLDTKNFLWAVRKNNDGTFLQKISSLEFPQNICATLINNKKNIILTTNDANSDFYFIENIDNTLTFLKKFSPQPQNTENNTKSIFGGYATKRIADFDNGILTYCLQFGAEAYVHKVFKFLSCDIETGKVINFFEQPWNGHFDGIKKFNIPSLKEIFAFIAFSNSSHDKTLLSALKQSTLINDLPEDYKNQLLKKIDATLSLPAKTETKEINENNDHIAPTEQDTYSYYPSCGLQ